MFSKEYIEIQGNRSKGRINLPLADAWPVIKGNKKIQKKQKGGGIN